MSSAASRFHSRAPRYIYSVDDQSMIRFAGMETRGQSVRAVIRDLSETGIAFTLEDTDPPDEGDMLKIQFTTPGDEQIACFATVTRVEPRVEWDPEIGDRDLIWIALQFRNLPQGHLQALQKSLQGRVQPEETADVAGQADQTKKYAIFAGLSLATIALFYWMCLPIEAWARLFS